MNRGEELLQAYTNAVEIKVATMCGVKNQSLQDDVDNKVHSTKTALLNYVAGLEDAIESVAKSIDSAISDLSK